MTDFAFDVFLSHSEKDKPIVRDLAQRLKADGLRVWLDEWEIQLGDSIPAKIEQGLEESRLLLLCMSVNAFESDWAQLESQTFRFRDPLNKQRRLLPLRLDDTPIKGSLVQLAYLNWQENQRAANYSRLLAACGGQAVITAPVPTSQTNDYLLRTIKLDNRAKTRAYAFAKQGEWLLTGGYDHIIRLWNLHTQQCEQEFRGHIHYINTLVWNAQQTQFLSASIDNTVHLWDVITGECIYTCQVHEKYQDETNCAIYSPDESHVISGSADNKLRLWDLAEGQCLRVFEGHSNWISDVIWLNENNVLSCSFDNTIKLWEINSAICVQTLTGHTRPLTCLAWSSKHNCLASASEDKTVRLWNIATGQCLYVLEGHISSVWSLSWHPQKPLLLSISEDGIMRLWRIDTNECLAVLQVPFLKENSVFHGAVMLFVGFGGVRYVCWSDDGKVAYSADTHGNVCEWDLSAFVEDMAAPKTLLKQVQYSIAKVLLVGDSGAGKTGLSQRLALNNWLPSDSTVGAWATQCKVPLSSDVGLEKEIWLWDFGGQADQRLIHALYMDDSALAVLVFDGQKEALFNSLHHWQRDLQRAGGTALPKLLVAGRVDTGGLRVSRQQLDNFCSEYGFLSLLETSAKENRGCAELHEAIIAAIPWQNLVKRSSPLLFKRLKAEIIALKDEGRVLLRFNELRLLLQLRLLPDGLSFDDAELNTVLGLLIAPAVLWRLSFGDWILLQPEMINAYAQAVIQTLQQDPQQRGCILEQAVLQGQLKYSSTQARLPVDEERFVLLAMHQMLIERGLCWRESSDEGTVLIFPSYYRRERPELCGHPSVWMSFHFSGFLDEIYATLVVRLHFHRDFKQAELWHDAADFHSRIHGGQLGIKLLRDEAVGQARLQLYFETTVSNTEKIQFSRYVLEHLYQHDSTVQRYRHYVCAYCQTPVENHKVAIRKLNDWLAQPTQTDPTIICVECEKRVSLWDELEQAFASEQTRNEVRQAREFVSRELDNESKERVLVGEVMSTVALARQISRELSVSDHGIDMEIEFKNDDGQATGKRLYLQLKSGNSYLKTRKRDNAQVFNLSKVRHAQYWREQAFPVMLVIRNSSGEIHWMDVREYLLQQSGNVKEIIFNGERFDVMSVRRWRERVLQH